MFAMSYTPNRVHATPPAPAKPASSASVAGDPRDGGLDGQSQDALFDGGQSPIGIDYAPVRCAGDKPYWLRRDAMAICAPQLGRDPRTCGHSESTCPALCEKCYADDLSFIKRELRVNTITIYQPSYYILKEARRLKMKVVVGLLNDSVLGLAAPAARKDCTYVASPLYHCGPEYASALIDGACVDTIGGDPFKLCTSHCAQRSHPGADCVSGDCSCRSDVECRGASNRCLSGVYLAPMNNPSSGEFLHDGTVIGIQLGNEFFKACQTSEVPGLHQPCCIRDKKTGQCNAWTVTREVISAAASNLRSALNSRGLNRVKITVNLVQEQGPAFCRNGAPPPGVDYIATHSYCDFVAEMPPQWTTLSGAECWDRARNHEFTIDQKACGASRTYIGETGYNTGCPLLGKAGPRLHAEQDFVNAMLGSEPACNGKPNPTAPIPNFLFEFVDVCPPGGCLAGCGDPHRCSYNCCCEHNCSATEMCAAECPRCIGNGYFGLFHAADYGTEGFPPQPKFDPMPSLLCPAAPK
ncbi:MAG TPA: hypothetical protein VGH29_00740 [Candidatus Binataceae bacterium]